MKRRILLAFLSAGFLLWGCPGGPEVCSGGTDEDKDGLIDCDDILDCSTAPNCQENCTNGIDDNGNGAIDCADAACTGDPACVESNCGDNVDNDGDNLVDCADTLDCGNNALCKETGNCTDNKDNDLDGLTDCADTVDCAADPACTAGGAENTEALCTDNLDNDSNGFTDCADRSCDVAATCITLENCGDLIDNDGDGKIDCQDGSCVGNVLCPLGAEICNDTIDNDGDGFIDCNDFDCTGDPACGTGLPEICNDGIDNDGDTFIDCNDFDCGNDPACAENDNTECTDTIDNDNDGFIDCVDRGCDAAAACIALEICNDGIDNDGDGKIDCADGSCIPNVVACPVATVNIQQVQDGTVAANSSITVNNVFVTGVHGAQGSNMNIYVQEANGVGNGHTYPEFAAVQIFITSGTTNNFAALAGLQVGDCVSFSGITSEFRTVITEVINPTAFTKAASAATCGTVPAPLVVPSNNVLFADVATDSDGVTAGDQIAANSEKFEDVLMTVQGLTVTSLEANNLDFRAIITGTTNGLNLLTSSFLFTFTAPTVNQTFNSITGIYTEFKDAAGTFDNFRIQPRNAADIQ